MSTVRNPWFDNIKGLLIFTVVFGHMIETYRDIPGNEMMLYLYNVIYFFHMPLFIILTGYFFKPNKPARIMKLFIVFIIWQLLNGVLSEVINEQQLISLTPESRIFSIFNPYWTLWYLLGVIVWSIVTPYFMKLRYPLVISIAFAVIISYADQVTGWFSLRKLINFYPYFLLGYILANKNVLTALGEKAKSFRYPLRWAALFVTLAFMGAMVFYMNVPKGTEFLFMRESYNYFDWPLWKGLMYHLLLYAGTIGVSVALMLLVPQGKPLFFFNRLGFFSLFIYLIHTNIIRVYRVFLPEEFYTEPIIKVAVALAGAVLISWIITREPILKFFKPLIQPDLKWLIKTESKQYSSKKESYDSQ